MASVTVGVVLVAGCFPAPKSDTALADSGTGGIDLGGSDESPFGSESGGSTGGAQGSSGGGDTTGTATTAAQDGTGSSGDGDTGGGWDTDGGELPPGFPGVEPFGDDVRELDLVGVWTLPWQPVGVPNVTLTIDAAGDFTWSEYDAACVREGGGDGFLWVSSGQLVLHFDAWDQPLPWDTEAALGVAVEAPFRTRLGYTPMGGYLGLAAPERMTAIAPWSGRAYVRLDGGSGGAGAWAAESELWAIPDGESSPTLLVRDRYDATLSGSAPASLSLTRTWWWPATVADAPVVQFGPWSDDTPGNTAGAATVLSILHAYDPTGLFTFTADRSFKLAAASPCG